MKRVFTTADVHPRDRFAIWHDVVCRKLVERDSMPECRQTFQAEIQVGHFADVDLALCANSPMTISHTARQAERANGDEILVCRQMSEILALEQDSREAVLEAGDMMLLDPRWPYVGKFPKDSRLLIFKIRRRDLEARVGNTRSLTACAIKRSESENRLASAFLGMLLVHSEKLEAPAAGIVKEHVLDLVAMSIAKTVEMGRPRVSSARSFTLLNVRAAIEARLSDPSLDSGSVAAAAGVTIRYANTVLAQESTSIVRLIQTRRLQRCRTALDDPLQAHRTVSEIAYGWGFSDMTHFGRKFRATYGVLPSEYRRRAKDS